MGVVLYAPALALNAGELTVPSPSVSAVMLYNSKGYLFSSF